MKPSTLTLLLHVGSIVGTGKDGIQLVEDFLQKKGGEVEKADALKFLDDLAGLVASEVIPLPPGVSAEEAQSIFGQLKVAFNF